MVLINSFLDLAVSEQVLLLTPYRPKSLLYRNQSVDLQSKSTDWFLYDGDIFRYCLSETNLESSMVCQGVTLFQPGSSTFLFTAVEMS